MLQHLTKCLHVLEKSFLKIVQKRVSNVSRVFKKSSMCILQNVEHVCEMRLTYICKLVNVFLEKSTCIWKIKKWKRGKRRKQRKLEESNKTQRKNWKENQNNREKHRITK